MVALIYGDYNNRYVHEEKENIQFVSNWSCMAVKVESFYVQYISYLLLCTR